MLFKVRYTNTVLKICQNCRLYMKIICCKLLKLCLHSETIESWCRGFLTYEITMPWLYCLSFSMLWCFSFPNLDFASFWSLNLDVVFFRSWDLYVVVYMSPRPRFRFHREISSKIISIILLKNISIIQVYATAFYIMHASAN